MLFLLCRDTFYIESFHVVILIYAAKRIHFGDETYEMRVHPHVSISSLDPGNEADSSDAHEACGSKPQEL